jgi:hypothetical protein
MEAKSAKRMDETSREWRDRGDPRRVAEQSAWLGDRVWLFKRINPMELYQGMKGAEKSVCGHERPERDAGQSYLARRSRRLLSPGTPGERLRAWTVGTRRGAIVFAPM